MQEEKEGKMIINREALAEFQEKANNCEFQEIGEIVQIIVKSYEIYEKLIIALSTCYRDEKDMLIISCALNALDNAQGYRPAEMQEIINQFLKDMQEIKNGELFKSKPFMRLAEENPVSAEERLAYRLRLDNVIKTIGEFIPGNLELSRKYIQYRLIIDEMLNALTPFKNDYSPVAMAGGILKAKNSFEDFNNQHEMDIQLLMDRFSYYDQFVDSSEVRRAFELKRKNRTS